MSTGGEYEETVEYYEGEKELRSAFEDVFGGEFRGKIDKELGNKSAMENCGEAGDESGENAIGENHNEFGKSNNEPNCNNIENSLNDIYATLATRSTRKLPLACHAKPPSQQIESRRSQEFLSDRMSAL